VFPLHLAALLLASTLAAPTVVVLDRDGNPVPGASVAFVAADDSRDTETANARGRATPRVAFAATRAQISAPNCASVTIEITGGEQRITLPCSLGVISRVRVATGSSQSLHALPFAASVLDRTSIATSPSATGDAMLRVLPGFDRTRSNSAFTNYGQLRVSFNGAGNDRGLVFVDGVPAQDGFGGQIDWTAYPTADVRRAELLRGPGSALYGAGAIGGVLSLDTFGPTQGEPEGALALAGGSRSFSTYYVAYTAALSRKLSASFSSQQMRMSYSDLPPGYTSPIDQPATTKNDMASFRFRYTASPGSIFEYGYLGAWDYQQEGRPNYEFWRRLVQHDFSYVHPQDRSQLALDYFVRNAFITNLADQAPTDPGVLRYTQYVPTSESGVGITWNVDSNDSTFQLRGDGRFIRGSSTQFGSTGAFQSAGSGAQQIGGLALQETVRPGRFEVVGGARFDVAGFFEGTLIKGPVVVAAPTWTDAAISPRFAVRYEANKHLALRVSNGSGIRFPFLNELVRGYVISGVSYLPNPRLIPERSNSSVGGFDWTNDRESIALDFTQTLVHNAIMFRTISPTIQIRSNVDGTQTDGTTLSYTHTLSACSRLSLSGTSQYARVTSGAAAIVGKRLQYIPQASASVALDGAVGQVGAGLSLSYLGQTFADDLNTQPLGTALVAGAHLAIPIQNGAAILINADNFTDARYLSSNDRYAPPSVVSIGLRVPLTAARTQAPAQCPATP
jgi:vitamin B12 transporter